MTAPNWQHPAAAAVAPQLQRLSDFFEGTDAVRERGATYVPQLEKETDKYYRMRSRAAAAPGALTRTVEGSTGRIFAVAPTLTPNGLPTITEAWQNLDGQGTHGDVWLSKAATYAILDGFACALVDAPQAPAPAVPLSEASRYRPRWVLYRRSQVLSWRHVIEDGRSVLTHVTLAETAQLDDGAWGTTTEARVRVLRRAAGAVTAEVWAERETNGLKAWQMIEGPFRYVGPTEIPIAILAGGKLTAPFVARPPLLPLCDKLIESYQVSVDMRHYERVACFPQPVVRGRIETGADGKVTLGPTSMIMTSAEGGFAWAEISGDSMEQLRENQRERKQEIGMLGLSFLVGETRSAETAKAKGLDSAAENATIADAARGIEDGANVALAFHAAYGDVVAQQAPTVSLNKNLSGESIDATLASVLLQMRAAGELTRAEYRQILARGKVIPAEMALDDAVQAAELEAALRDTGIDEPLEDAA